MATYKEVQKDIELHEGFAPNTCWLSHLRELHNLHTKQAPNRKSNAERVYPCPDSKRAAIERSFRRMGWM